MNDALSVAFGLLLTLDAELLRVVGLSFRVSATACLTAIFCMSGPSSPAKTWIC